ncbi:unnamed protein product [Prunus armeniaca]
MACNHWAMWAGKISPWACPGWWDPPFARAHCCALELEMGCQGGLLPRFGAVVDMLLANSREKKRLRSAQLEKEHFFVNYCRALINQPANCVLLSTEIWFPDAMADTGHTTNVQLEMIESICMLIGQDEVSQQEFSIRR